MEALSIAGYDAELDKLVSNPSSGKTGVCSITIITLVIDVGTCDPNRPIYVNLEI